MYKKYIAEFIGTFCLSLVVLLAVSMRGPLPIAVPLIAGFTLMLFVYTIGSISGSHINPAVTLGLLSIKKISLKDAGGYIVAQLLGGFLSLVLVESVLDITLKTVRTGAFDSGIFFAEALGMFFFAFGIASVVYGKTKDQMSGVVVGGSLLLGIMVASFSGALGILNTAVAVALGATTVVYLIAPIVGSVAGFWAYKSLSDSK
jgi:glycerol uptake facilitator-like aquaporin